MFTGLLTGRKQAFRALELSIAASEELIKLRSEVRELEDRLATLEGQHKTLRGRFYATRSDAEVRPDPLGATREERRIQALARHRIANGVILPTIQEK